MKPILKQKKGGPVSWGDARLVKKRKKKKGKAYYKNKNKRKTLTEIANELGLGVGTVGTYRSRILSKTTLKNNSQITNYAFKNKLIQ